MVTLFVSPGVWWSICTCAMHESMSQHLDMRSQLILTHLATDIQSIPFTLSKPNISNPEMPTFVPVEYCSCLMVSPAFPMSFPTMVAGMSTISAIWPPERSRNDKH